MSLEEDSDLFLEAPDKPGMLPISSNRFRIFKYSYLKREKGNKKIIIFSSTISQGRIPASSSQEFAALVSWRSLCLCC